MERRDKFRKLAITAGIAVGIFAGLLGFVSGANKAEGGGEAAGLGLLMGILYFCVATGSILLIYKIFEWSVFGFQSDQEKGKRGNKAVIIRRSCRRVALVSTIIAAFLCGLVVGLFPAGEYREAKRDLEIFESQKKDYEGKAYYDYMQRERIKDNYWLNLPEGMLVLLCITAGLLSAVLSFFGIWFVYKFFERLVLNFYGVKEEE
ncbi:MAG: hypothetical protein ACYS1A_15685 [Planctomycetota bacterium]|jgi:hypothetical protein